MEDSMGQIERTTLGLQRFFRFVYLVWILTKRATARRLTSKSGFTEEGTLWAKRHSKGFKIIFFLPFWTPVQEQPLTCRMQTWGNICTQRHLSVHSCGGHQPSAPALMLFFAFVVLKGEKKKEM